MNQDLALKIVAEWLEETALPELTPRDVPEIDPERLSDILAVVGPRRAGKTFFLYQMIQTLFGRRYTRKDILFIDFEDYRLSGMAPHDVDALLSAFHQLAGKQPSFLFFDEVHHLPHWSRVLRTLHNQRKYRLIVSGSNSKLLSEEIATELRGRYRDVKLFPFSFREFLHFKRLSFSSATLHTPSRGALRAAFEEYLQGGGFPEVVRQETASEKRRLLQSYYQTTFYKDLVERHNIKAKALLEALMSYSLNVYGDLFSISAFEKYIKGHMGGGSKRTIANYLGYLREAFFLILHEKFSYSPKERMMNPKKLYLLDTGFNLLSSNFSENRGKALENVVAIEYSRRRQEAFYFKGRQECDFLLKDGVRPSLAVQVCWELNPRNERREWGGLQEAMTACRIPHGLILTHDQEMNRTVNGKKVIVLPVWKWLLEN